MSRRIRSFCILLVICCSGCSILPRNQPPQVTYDFGPASAPAADASGFAITFQGISAPAWLDSNAIQYRLAYQDEFRRQSYRDSRWVAAPLVLIRQRFAQRVGQRAAAGAGATPLSLRIELDEFVQIFDSSISSRIQVRLRALVEDPKAPAFARARTFTIEQAASSPDSAGAVRAFATAVDEVVTQTLAWASAP